ncbi:MAG TPA: DUF2939 domain-containing protein [Thermomonas sp.]|nr:DUF2939 domain-containing protein [Thermomonas sp.]
MKLTPRTRWLLASPLLLLLLAVLGYVVAGPFLAIHSIRDLVARGQTQELWRFVDFDSLRESVRPQLQQKIAQSILARTGNTQSARNVGEVTVMLAKPAIDAMTSPQGFAVLLQGSSLARSTPVSTSGKAPPNDPLKTAVTHFESTSLLTATVQNAEGQPVIFEFHRHGLAWKLDGLRLPP